jgi:DNA-directed RNA polymerase specialized sigma24 family protein
MTEGDARRAAQEAVARADRETAERLLAAEARRQEVRTELAEADAELSRAVNLAVEDGWTLARIAECLGMSRQRIGQLKTGTR